MTAIPEISMERFPSFTPAAMSVLALYRKLERLSTDISESAGLYMDRIEEVLDGKKSIMLQSADWEEVEHMKTVHDVCAHAMSTGLEPCDPIAPFALAHHVLTIEPQHLRRTYVGEMRDWTCIVPSHGKKGDSFGCSAVRISWPTIDESVFNCRISVWNMIPAETLLIHVGIENSDFVFQKP